MKNHEIINGRVIQTNKNFSHLNQKQKLKIHEWLYEAFTDYVSGQIKEYDIVDTVYKKIEEADIWIPYREIERYYSAHKNKFRRRYEKAKTKENQSQVNI